MEPLVLKAEELLRHRSPELRGEAALILASTRVQRHHAAILEIARDRHPEARLRGILALGILGAPGSEVLLGSVLQGGATQVGPDCMAAALALGLLPEGHPAHAVDEYLVRFRRSSYRRQRDVLASMLVGMTRDQRPSRVTALRSLLEDDANRDVGLRTLIIQILVAVPGALDEEEVDGLLASPREEELTALLGSLVSAQRRLPAPQLVQIERIAARDRSPRVRAAALDYLTLNRHLPALELATQALDSDHPEELAAAVRNSVKLGGGALCNALESRILEEDAPALQAAMLAAFTGYHSDGFRKGCAGLAMDRTRPLAVRVHAAVIAVAMGEPALAPLLRRMFLDAQDPELLTLLATALVRVSPHAPLVASIHPPAALEDLARLGQRLRALVAAGHPEAYELLSQALKDNALDPVTKADLLRAWRLGAWSLLDPSQVEMLPAVLIALLR
jgi:hypothetical protein